MKTLVIHPKDATTDFLSPIYEGMKECDVIKSGKTRENIKKLIPGYDQVIMLGHGSPAGLYSSGAFGREFMIIDDSFAGLLRKKNCVFIWCNADRFVQAHQLKGFFTGMFISEYAEAQMYHVPTNYTEIEASNNLFAQSFANREMTDLKNVWQHVKKIYNNPESQLITFNNERLYVRA